MPYRPCFARPLTGAYRPVLAENVALYRFPSARTPTAVGRLLGGRRIAAPSRTYGITGHAAALARPREGESWRGEAATERGLLGGRRIAAPTEGNEARAGGATPPLQGRTELPGTRQPWLTPVRGRAGAAKPRLRGGFWAGAGADLPPHRRPYGFCWSPATHFNSSLLTPHSSLLPLPHALLFPALCKERGAL